MEQFISGHAIEYAHRPALKALISTSDYTIAVNDPKHSQTDPPDIYEIAPRLPGHPL